MSSIASFYRVPRADLSAEGGVAELVERSVDLGEDYGWPGAVMLNLLTALEEHGVSLGAEVAGEIEPDEDAGEVFLATPSDLAAIEGLDLNQVDEESLREGLQLDDEELREAIAESVTTLHQLIAGTGPDEVLVIAIG